jgi:hypothetical protein
VVSQPQPPAPAEISIDALADSLESAVEKQNYDIAHAQMQPVEAVAEPQSVAASESEAPKVVDPLDAMIAKLSQEMMSLKAELDES